MGASRDRHGEIIQQLLRGLGEGAGGTTPYSDEAGACTFAGEAEFLNNGAGTYEGPGSALYNSDGGIVIFDDDVSFTENESLHKGGAICNYSKIKFYGKAYFTDNKVNDGTGGALYSEAGNVKFKGAAQFVGNTAREEGGGAITMEGGDMRFEKFVTITGNDASDTGGAMWVTEAATVDFWKPSKVVMSGNTLQDQGGCLNVDASEDSEIIGYTGIDGDLCGGYSE